MQPDWLLELQQAVGAEHVKLSGVDDLSAFEVDWRKRHRGRARAVVLPGSTAEVAAVVKVCAAHGVAVVPQGGNTGLVVGSVPDDSGSELVLSLKRLQQVRRVDAHNLTITVEAGCPLQVAQEAAQQAGLLLPLSMASEGSCTIGGNLATNAGGTQVLRYGNARELCLGLEVVTAQGEVWRGLHGLRKDNTGYALRDLFIGSEGTLGVITAATLKLFPAPVAQWTAWAALDSLAAAVAFLGLARRHLGASLTAFEVMGKFPLQLVRRHFAQWPVPLADSAPWCVLLETSDCESGTHAQQQLETLLQEGWTEGIVLDSVVAQSQAQARQLWHIREAIPLAQAQEGLNIKHDISLPVSAIPAFCTEADALLQETVPGCRIVNFGHLGDGNLHYNVQAPEGVDANAFLREHESRINALVFDAVLRHGGSISAEHGIGRLKVNTLPRYKDPVALAMMARIKEALDPDGIMNPGKVLQRRTP